MLTSDWDQNCNKISLIAEKVFNPVIRLSVEKIFFHTTLPYTFNYNYPEIWRFSASFYGFYYDASEKSYILSSIFL